MTSPVDLLKSLHKRRLTRRGRPPREDSEDELGEAYYEHQITDDKVLGASYEMVLDFGYCPSRRLAGEGEGVLPDLESYEITLFLS